MYREFKSHRPDHLLLQVLLDELNRLFSDVVHPGYAGLADSYPNEWESTLRHLDGKNWRAVTLEDFDSQGGIYETISVLSLKGFIYFLPGLIRLAHAEPDSLYPVADILAGRFTRPQPQIKSKAWAKAKPVTQSISKAQRILSALSLDRREFLMRFLASSLVTEPTLCPVVIDSAIFNLRVGEIVPYDQEAVSQWAAKSVGAFKKI